MRRYVFGFGIGSPPSEEPTRELLGGKGYGLANMAQLGLRVPPGFTITTEACNYFYAHDSNLPAGLKEDAVQALRDIEKVTGRQFGGDTKSDSFPLLVSVRSGARASMPGMMDTILNLGLNDRSVEQLARATKDRRFALDCYRRFIQMYSQIVLGMSHDIFEGILERAKHTALVELDSELSAKDLEQVVAHYKDAVTQHTKQAFPQDPHEQLWNAVGAVFRSWMNQRAVDYRALHDIPQDWGTAVNVQAMVYGNKGADCATGVAFTRDPNTGALGIFGEFLPNAQGEDVVSGTRDAHPISEAGKRALGSAKQSLEELMPDAYRQLADALARLEQHHEDMQDTEFTIEGGMLWMLQTRTGKRSAQAAITIAVNMAEEGKYRGN
jgi:pyruvate,orthophosphate dikinase